MTQFEVFVSIYLIITGFVCSGVLGSLYQLVNTQPAGFAFSCETWLSSLAGVFFCIFAGPFIIMRNTLRARKMEGRRLGWVVAASAIASLWSFCTGLLIVHMTLSLSSALTEVV